MPLAVTIRDQRLAVLDRRIRLAWDALLKARDSWAHSPNGETIRAEEDAEQHLNSLLEQRHALQPRRPGNAER